MAFASLTLSGSASAPSIDACLSSKLAIVEQRVAFAKVVWGR
jgi:hypothetical protein